MARCQTLECPQTRPRLAQHARWYAGQLRHLDAVTLARRTGLDLVQKHHAPAVFGGFYMHIGQRRVLGR